MTIERPVHMLPTQNVTLWTPYVDGCPNGRNSVGLDVDQSKKRMRRLHPWDRFCNPGSGGIIPFHIWSQPQHLPSSNLLELNEASPVIRLRHRGSGGVGCRQKAVVWTKTSPKSIGPPLCCTTQSDMMRAPVEGFWPAHRPQIADRLQRRASPSTRTRRH